MSWARVHRWLAIVLVAPLIVWSITGVLFHLKPGWGRAYDMLDIERPATLPLGTLAHLEVGPVSRLELFDTALGPLYRVTTAAATALYDARTGHARSPLSADDARTLVADAIARSTHRSEYGEIVRADAAGGTVQVQLTGGVVVEVDRDAGRLSQHGRDTDRIDWLYRIHYLQWTGNHVVDRVLAVLGLALIWAVLVPGLVLFVRRARE